MIRARAIERLADRQPGRRGFGGTGDPEEAAAFRIALRGDRGLDPALNPAATWDPLESTCRHASLSIL